ncbi:hypothetical protein AMAG_07839 [Allomyces macrogynus ATCC 38327]|uniref:Uncharacterized protein n=1 Tax=Allomyces macrogynus (strain ATCC 38327) TaxID=578462 RepID=A0A0L0SJG7_ALLM3|nr:hypothetical protein AMAG_07839 [Allomyces macrogynus ATCC 38327]|eukprot:KNE62643.1 hypothetical protein AMAG_07839 [Allomyces macrogynus ATCC 38327]
MSDRILPPSPTSTAPPADPPAAAPALNASPALTPVAPTTSTSQLTILFYLGAVALVMAYFAVQILYHSPWFAQHFPSLAPKTSTTPGGTRTAVVKPMAPPAAEIMSHAQRRAWGWHAVRHPGHVVLSVERARSDEPFDVSAAAQLPAYSPGRGSPLLAAVAPAARRHGPENARRPLGTDVEVERSATRPHMSEASL